MKKLLYIIAISVIVFSSCNNKSDSAEAAHTHEDGTEHSDCDHEKKDKPEQEIFTLDSTDNDAAIVVEATKTDDHSGVHSHE